jgi:hypothetical protein
LKVTNNKQNNFDGKLVNYISYSMKPFSTVEDQSFVELVEVLDKNIKVMSRRTLMRRIEESKDLVQAEIGRLFEKASNVATCADIWATKSDSYFGVAATCVDDNFKRQIRLLACRPFPNPHTGERIAEVLFDIHREFGLDRGKLVGTTTDNASNNIKAFKDFGLKLKREKKNDDDGEDEESDEDEIDSNNSSVDDIDEDIWLPEHFRLAFFLDLVFVIE